MTRNRLVVGISSICLVLGSLASASVAYAEKDKGDGDNKHEQRVPPQTNEQNQQHDKAEQGKKPEQDEKHEQHDDSTATGPVRPVTLSNLGSKPLSGIVIKFSGKDAHDFRQTNDCGEKLAGKAKCTINVTFAPTTRGQKSADLEVHSSGGRQIVHLSGTGT